jgi:putative flippase GtrA
MAEDASSLKPMLGLIARFGLVGLANTVLGFGVIAGLDVGLHVAPALANAAGYGVGVLSGFLLNRSFVFRSQGGYRSTGAKYFLMVILAFALNQAVLFAAGRVLGPGSWQHLLAQLCGMGTYTVVTFILCKVWVFREAQPSG